MYTVAIHAPGTGLADGASTFSGLLTGRFESSGIRVVPLENFQQADCVLLTTGTRKLHILHAAKRNGTPIVLRLDGLWRDLDYWRVSLPVHLRNLRNASLLNYIRQSLASGVIYQSHFIRRSWEQRYGPSRSADIVILNGTDTSFWHASPTGHLRRLIVVEGSVDATFGGLETLVALGESLNQGVVPGVKEIIVAGRASATFKRAVARADIPVSFTGVLPREALKLLHQSAFAMLVLERNPPCPNSVLEGLSSGVPVVGYDTGSLREILGTGLTEWLAPFPGNPRRLSTPSVQPLVEILNRLEGRQSRVKMAARHRAVEALGIERAVQEYVAFMSSLK